MKAVLNGAVLAESDKTIEIEGNQYFPPDSVKREYLSDSGTHTTCPWKGEASYYHVIAGDMKVKDGAWYYPEPKPAAAQIKGYVAFGRPAKLEK